MTDKFYQLKKINIKKAKDILTWADKNGLLTSVTMLGYFVIILRRQMNMYLILSQDANKMDVLEIGIRGIDADGKEYFIMIYLEKEYLTKLQNKFELKKL